MRNQAALKQFWRALFVVSALLAVSGVVMLVWGIAEGVPWRSSAIGVFVMVMGGLLMRMFRRMLGTGQRPRPRETFLLLFVMICAQLWIAFVSGVQR